MSRILNIGAAQMGPIAPDESRASAVARMIDLLRQAKERGCHLVVFPELALTTFFPAITTMTSAVWTITSKPKCRVRNCGRCSMPPRPPTSPSTSGTLRKPRTGIATIPRSSSTAIASSVNIARCICRATPNMTPSGRFQHLEKRYFEPGDLGFPVWRCKGGIMGMAICNDRRWPETYRVMSLQRRRSHHAWLQHTGCEHVGFEPNHLRMFHNHLVMQASAYQNSCFVIGTAKAGMEDGCMLIGGSCIIQPSGEIVALASTVADELITSACDLDLARMGKETVFNFAKHRRVEHYGIIASQTGSSYRPTWPRKTNLARPTAPNTRSPPMSAAAPEAIRLADYRPPAYLIEGIDLTFALTDGAATVTAEVTGRRNPAAAAEDRDLVLNGRDLKPLASP